MSDFETYIRTGDSTGLKDEGDGGVIAPNQTEAKVNAALAERSPFRRICSIKTMSSGVPGELYAMPAATQSLLDDGVADVDQWLADEVRDVFAAQETASFVTGDGDNKPRGILFDADKLRKLNVSAISLDFLITLTLMPSARHRNNGSFVMNRRTVAELRKIKDADGNYIWRPSYDMSQPSWLIGYPVHEVEDMPDVAQGQCPIAFGDFRDGYLIYDRQGVRVLRDPYSAKPYVLFYTTKRVGGGIQDESAIVLMQISDGGAA